MPKRSTTTFTSEDAPAVEGAQLFVYYCKYSGEHCLITDTKLSELPRRRTDGALILDTQACIARLKAAPQPPKLIKRAEDHYEKQFRYCTSAELPYAYRTEQDGRFLYILPDSLTSYSRGDGAVEGVPVPPCIQRVAARAGAGGPPGVQVALALEERAKSATLLRVSADDVAVAVTAGAAHCGDELLTLFARVLGAKHSQLSLAKGWSDRSKMLLVSGMQPEDVYKALTAWLEADKARGKGGYA